jgi:hypothetical protein
MIFFVVISAVFGRFWPLLGDLEPFLREDLGRNLGGSSQIKNYLSQRFLVALEVQRRRNF